MFSNNQKISNRQFGRLLTLELFGMTTLLLPKILCETSKRDGILALAIGIIFLIVFVGLIIINVNLSDGDLIEYTKKCIGKTCTDFVILLLTIQTILIGSFALGLCGELVRNVLLQHTNVKIIIISFWLIGYYGAQKGIESRGRMSEVVFWPFLVPFLVVLLVALKGIELENFPPALTTNVGDIVQGGYEVLAVFQGVLFSILVLPYVSNKKVVASSLRKSIMWNAFLCAALFFIIVGVFGINMVSVLRWPVISLMTTSGFNGSFIRRLDVFMVTIWIFAFYFLISGSMQYGKNLVEKLLEKENSTCIGVVVAILILLLSFVLGDFNNSFVVYKYYMFFIGIPVSTIVLLLLCIIGSIKKQNRQEKGGGEVEQ